MKSLLREFIRQSLLEVDVLPPEKDPRMQKFNSSSSAQATPQDIAKMMAPPQKDGAAQPSSGSATQKPGKMGSAYQSKEDTRTKVQQTIAQKVKGGGISSDDDLQRYIADTKRIKDDGKFDADDDSLDLSLTSLKMVPLSVWKQLR